MVHVIKCAGWVRGIAQQGTELFVCAYRNERVAVYDLNTYSLTRHVIVPGMRYARSLVACKQNNCLYISDYASKCIHRVVLSKPSRRPLFGIVISTKYSFSKWPLNTDSRGVSLTRAFNLLVTLPEPQSIEEYTTSGSLIRSIKLDVSIDSPRQPSACY